MLVNLFKRTRSCHACDDGMYNGYFKFKVICVIIVVMEKYFSTKEVNHAGIPGL